MSGEQDAAADGSGEPATAEDATGRTPDGDACEGWPAPPSDVPDDWVHRERAFRGISVRLAVHYLGNLGGTVVHETATDGDPRLIAAEDWRATLSSVEVGVGPTVSLTEVRIAFAGDPDGLDALVDRFAQKAMRAGG
jgi:hypothetical protein